MENTGTDTRYCADTSLILGIELIPDEYQISLSS